jgi:hypothetical protein
VLVAACSLSTSPGPPATVSLNGGVDAPNAYLRSVALRCSRRPKECLMFIGVDTHKDTLAARCVDGAGRAGPSRRLATTRRAKSSSWPALRDVASNKYQRGH